MVLCRYVLREPRDRQWGVPTADGNWSGTVGTLQHQLADFSLSLAPTAPRLQVTDYSRIYISESFVIISLEPQPLPQSLSLVRPFAGNMTTLGSQYNNMRSYHRSNYAIFVLCRCSLGILSFRAETWLCVR